MKEFLGGNLNKFFNNANINAILSYKGDKYEVWEVSDEDYEKMCNMSDDEFETLLEHEWSWWRGCEGSNVKNDTKEFIINNRKIIAWKSEYYAGGNKFPTLLEYLCMAIGASTEKNVCACAMDLAKMNNMKMSELFQKYVG